MTSTTARVAVAFAALMVSAAQAAVASHVRFSRMPMASLSQRTPLSSVNMLVPTDAPAMVASSMVLAEQQDVFRLALAGGVGIMIFSIVNAMAVGAVARGNWGAFEEEAASWTEDNPEMSEMRRRMLSDEDFEGNEDEAQ